MTTTQVTNDQRSQTVAQRGDAAKALQRGEATYNRKDYGTARREWESLAQHGHAVAQNWLGCMYQQGLGVTQDETAAVRLYQQAAAQGYAAAQSNLGFMYAEGRGVAKNEAEAVRLFQQAATQGLAAAQGRLGLMYAEGRRVAKDETETVRLFQQAAAQGYALGQYGMGLMYEQGLGVTRNLAEAQRWFTQAAETASFASDRSKAMQARERVTRQLAPPQPLAPWGEHLLQGPCTGVPSLLATRPIRILPSAIPSTMPWTWRTS
jgi:TPR repeat protein